MRFLRAIVLVCGVVLGGTAAAQTTQHARLMVQAGGTFITSVAFSPDGSRVLTGSLDKSAWLWDVKTGKELQRYEGHASSVFSVAYSPDGRTVLTGSMDKTARLWDVETGKELRRFEGHSATVNSVAFSPNGRWALTGSEDKTARLWDVQTGKEVQRFEGHTNSVGCVAFSPDGRKVLTGSRDKTARLWDVQTAKEVQRFEGHSAEVYSVGFSPDGRMVITGSEDQSAWVWDVQTGHATRRWRFSPEKNYVNATIFSPDGRRALLATSDGVAQLWDVETGQRVQIYQGHSNYIIGAVFSRDGRWLLTGSGDKTARLWDVGTGKELQRFEGHSAPVYCVTFSPDGRRLLTSSRDTTAKLWDLGTGKELQRFAGHSDSIGSVAFSGDGRRVVTGSDDKTARLWNVDTGKEVRRFEGHTAEIYSVAYSPDGRKVLTGSDDKTARLWDIETGKELERFEGHTAPLRSVAFSPDGRKVLTGSLDKTARLWDAETGGLLQRFEGHDAAIEFAAFSPDGRRVVTGSRDYTAKLWDAESGKLLQTFSGHSLWVRCVAFSPNGQYVLTGSLDNTARLWDVNTGKELQRFVGHPAALGSVAFSPNGRKIVTSSMDGTARLWDTASGTQLASLVSFTEGGWAVVDSVGHYDASDPDSSSSLFWVTGNLRTIDLGQLKREYFTPGLLARAMLGERLPDVTGMNTVALPPVLAVAGEYNPATKKLPVDIKNDGGGVGKLLIEVNDRLLRTVEKPAAPAESKSITLPIDLADAPFVAGDNTIRITAYDAANRIESHPAVAHYTRTASATLAKGSQVVAEETALNAGKFYAIIVGTSTFGGPDLPNLMFPAKDAESFATGIRLGAERLYGKDKVWLRVLTTNFKTGEPKTGDGLPTKQNIRAAFDEVRKTARPEDTLVVYLSGHGAMSSSNRDLYYYLTMDARSFDIERDPALRNVSTVSSQELLEWLREPVRTMPLKQVVILDTCAAGGATNDLVKLAERRDIPPDQRRAIELLKDATGTFILMGSAADSVSYEASRYGEGLLTYALLQGMRGESLDDDSRLGVNRWFEKASEDVPDLAKSIGGIQKPVIAAPKGTGFPVALMTREDREKIPLATVKPQLMKVVCENEDQEDPLDLRTLVREQMRALNYAQARGEAAVIYLDATDDELAGALAPKLRYVQSGDTVRVRVKLVAKDKSIPDQTITGSASDKQALAKKLADTIVAMAVANT